MDFFYILKSIPRALVNELKKKHPSPSYILSQPAYGVLVDDLLEVNNVDLQELEVNNRNNRASLLIETIPKCERGVYTHREINLKLEECGLQAAQLQQQAAQLQQQAAQLQQQAAERETRFGSIKFGLLVSLVTLVLLLVTLPWCTCPLTYPTSITPTVKGLLEEFPHQVMWEQLTEFVLDITNLGFENDLKWDSLEELSKGLIKASKRDQKCKGKFTVTDMLQFSAFLAPAAMLLHFLLVKYVL